MDPFAFEHALLPCGADVYWQDQPQALYVSLRAIVWVGSFQDPPGKEGLAHLFEHLPFRGTERFPSKQALSLPIETTGGSHNAATHCNLTEFTVDIATQHSLLGWEILEELVFRPRLDSEGLATEVAVVESEIVDFEQHAPREDYRRFQSVLLGEDLGQHAQGLGTSESLQCITMGDFREFHRRYYQPANMTFVVSGNLSGFPGGIPRYIGERLESFGSASRWERRTFAPQVGHLPESWTSRKMPTHSPVLWLAGPMHVDVDDFTRTAEGVIDSILCMRGMSSVLFEELRERRGLVYGIHSTPDRCDINLGWWGYEATLRSKKDVALCQKLIAEILMSPHTFTDQQVEWSRQSMLGTVAMMPITPSGVNNYALKCLDEKGSIPLLSEALGRLKSVTSDQVRGVAAKYYDPSRWVSVTFLP